MYRDIFSVIYGTLRYLLNSHYMMILLASCVMKCRQFIKYIKSYDEDSLALSDIPTSQNVYSWIPNIAIWNMRISSMIQRLNCTIYKYSYVILASPPGALYFSGTSEMFQRVNENLFSITVTLTTLKKITLCTNRMKCGPIAILHQTTGTTSAVK